MALTLCQKMLTIFCRKAKNFAWFGPYDFVQIAPGCGPNTGCPKLNFTILNVSNVRTNIRIETPAIYIDRRDL